MVELGFLSHINCTHCSSFILFFITIFSPHNKRYHQVKFFERQKLTRMERKAKKKLKEAKEAADFEDATKYTNELMQICMDQLYVAFYPNDKKYVSIFANQSEDEKIKKRRIEIKQDILTKIKNNVITKSDLMQKSWVNIDMLRKRDFDLSLAELPSCYQLAMGHDYCNDTSDKRKSSAAIAAVQNWEQKRKLDVKEDTEVHLIKRTKHDKTNRNQDDHGEDCNDDNRKNRDTSNNNDDQNVDDDSSTSSSSSSSSSSSNSSSSSSSSNSSSSSSSDSDSDSDDNDDDNVANTKQDTIQSDEESLDDFLVDDTDQTDVGNIFAKAQREALTSQDMPYEKRKGDKSQGWQTQKQRPGEWKGDKHHKRFI